MKKIIMLVGALFIATGCARTIHIDDEKLGTTTASLVISSDELQGDMNVPLVISNVVNVKLSKFPSCENGSPLKEEITKLGKATLTPSKNTQTFTVPAEVELLIYAESEDNRFGSIYTCFGYASFPSSPNRIYHMKFKPHVGNSLKKINTCSIEIYEKVEGSDIRMATADYPNWVMEPSGRKPILCEKSIASHDA